MTVKDFNERESQLSAMFDGELPQAECELLARRLSRDENLRRSWENYALIGAAMRSEEMAGERLASKVAAAIAKREGGQGAEKSAAAPAQGWSRFAIPLGSAALAASIAVIGVLGVFGLGSRSGDESVTAATVPASTVKEVVIPAAPAARPIIVAAASPSALSRVSPDSGRSEAASASRGDEPVSYVTPPIREGGAGSSLPPFELASYVGAHSAVSAPMLRHSAISAVIASPQPAVAVAPISEAPR